MRETKKAAAMLWPLKDKAKYDWLLLKEAKLAATLAFVLKQLWPFSVNFLVRKRYSWICFLLFKGSTSCVLDLTIFRRGDGIKARIFNTAYGLAWVLAQHQIQQPFIGERSKRRDSRLDWDFFAVTQFSFSIVVKARKAVKGQNKDRFAVGLHRENTSLWNWFWSFFFACGNWKKIRCFSSDSKV